MFPSSKRVALCNRSRNSGMAWVLKFDFCRISSPMRSASCSWVRVKSSCFCMARACMPVIAACEACGLLRAASMAMAMAAIEARLSPCWPAIMRARWCCVTWAISWLSTAASSDSLCAVQILFPGANLQHALLADLAFLQRGEHGLRSIAQVGQAIAHGAGLKAQQQHDGKLSHGRYDN